MSYDVALIGAGIIARNHLNAIRQLDNQTQAGRITAVAVADIDEMKGREIATEYDLSFYVDYREMVMKERPDMVIIALPHYLHESCAVWCAEQGCNLLLEKPMALNLPQCDAILEAVTSSSVTLMVGHTQHYWPANIQAKELIQSGKLGKLIAIHDTRHLYYYSEARPAWFLDKDKAGGGIVMNLGAHSIDKIQWLTDSKVSSVLSSLSYEGPVGNVEGSGCVFLRTTNHVTAVIVQSGYTGVANDVTELIFTNGMAKLISSRGLWISKDGQYELVQPHDQRDPFELQLEDFIQAIESNGERESSGRYARSVIATLEAVYESDKKGVEMTVEHAPEATL